MNYSDLTAGELRFLNAWRNATPEAQQAAALLLNLNHVNAEAEPAEIVPFPSGDQHAEGDTNG